MMMKKTIRYDIYCEEWREEDTVLPCYGLVCGGYRIRFISTDRPFVAQVASLLNRLQATPEKALEIIEQLLP